MKKTKYWNTRTQTGLLFTGVGVLIALNFFLIFKSNRITKIREATAQLVLETAADVNQLAFHSANVATGRGEYKESLGLLVERVEENLDFLEDGGVIIQNENSLRIPKLPSSAQDHYKAFRGSWSSFKAGLEALQNSSAVINETFNHYEPYEVPTDSGTFIQYRQASTTFEKYNPNLAVPVQQVVERSHTLDTDLENLRKQLNDQYWLRRFGFQAGTVASSILCVIGLILAYMILIRKLFDPLSEVHRISVKIAEGDLDCEVPEQGYGEVVALSTTLNQLLERLGGATEFAGEIGKGEFESEFHVANQEDKLGYALLEMRDNLRQVAEEDRKRNWANEGMAKFGDILRSNHDSEKDLAYSVVSNLVQYLGINQGGLFTKNEKPDGTEYLELQAAYAYSRRKFLEREIELGEGLIGQAALEGNVIYLTEIPEEYALIQSGMGEGHPNCIVILPLMLNEVIYGALELASFDMIEEYQVEFLKKISESITSTLATSRTNQRTKFLLEDAQQMTEEMKAQEEEMRQNMEELQATQEEMARKQKELAQNDHRFRQMTQNVPGMIFQLQMSQEGTARFVFVSSASKNLIGLVPEEVTEAPDHEEVLRLVAEDKDNYRKALLTSGQALSPLNWEGRILGDDGKSVKWITISAQPERDAQDNVLWNGLVADISEKKRNEEQMRVMINQLEAKDIQVSENVEILEQTKQELEFMNRELGSLMSSIEGSAFVLEVNKELKIRRVNPVLLDFLGYQEKALVRKDLKMIFDNDVAASTYYSNLTESLKAGKHLETYTEWQTKTGNSVWVHLQFFPTQNDAGKILKITCIGSAVPKDLHPQQPLMNE